jgi:predicted dehydrogenase
MCKLHLISAVNFSLGCHDISAMRELLGMPKRCIGANLKYPFWSAILDYGDFTVTYESGIDEIPRFDAHIEIYSPSKSIRVEFDSPYIKGLPSTMYIEENIDGTYAKSKVRFGYEDAFTLEMKELYKSLILGRPTKTTAEDARKDLEIFQMIARVGFSAYAIKSK